MLLQNDIEEERCILFKNRFCMCLFLIEFYSEKFTQLLKGMFLVIEDVVSVYLFHMCKFIFEAICDYLGVSFHVFTEITIVIALQYVQ